MIIPPHPYSVTAASEWKAAEAEVLRALAAVTAACTAYIAARDAEEPPACNLPGSVV